MSAVYLLPCHGGRHVEVTAANAGYTVICPCGKPVVVPTLRDLRQLPLAGAKSTSDIPQAPTWSIQQGILFSFGLILIVSAAIAVTKFALDVSKLETDKIVLTEEQRAAMDTQVHQLQAHQTLDVFDVFNHPLPENRLEPDFEAQRARARQLYRYMGIAGIVAAVGLVLVVAGILLKPRRKQARRRRAPTGQPPVRYS